MTVVERFMSKVDKQDNGCWLWNAGVFGSGYGAFGLNGSVVSAHRAAWIIFRGELPAGIHVLHDCDVKLCVNPEHLHLGTNSDNLKEAYDRELRHARKGADHFKSRLTDDVVREVRQKHAEGNVTYEALSKQYGISNQSMRDAIIGKTWKHVT